MNDGTTSNSFNEVNVATDLDVRDQPGLDILRITAFTLG